MYFIDTVQVIDKFNDKFFTNSIDVASIHRKRL